MTDNRPGDPEKPDLTTTEMRQANSRRMNLRVLIIGVIVVAIGFALAIWYNTSVTPDTETTTPAGETLEDTAPADGVPATDTDMDNGALPIPTDDAIVEEPAPAPAEEPAAEPAPTVDDTDPAVEDTDPVVDEPEAAPEEEPVAQ